MIDSRNAMTTDQNQTDEVLGDARSTALLSGRARIIALMVLIVAGIAYFATIAFQEATIEYMLVDDVVETSYQEQDSNIGVLGKLVPGSYIRSPDGITANFKLRDEHGSRVLPVVYDGEVGQVFFNDHSEIIINGTLESDGVFHAEALSVRCPSKYLTEQEQLELEGEPQPPPYQPDYFDSQPDA